MRNYLSRNELLSLVVFLLLFPIVPTFGQSDSGFVVTRLNNGQPIIDQTMFAAVGAEGEGANINGPSLIRIPDWILPSERADPSAVYYLYFAHHAGDYIRMAWATDVAGPWTLYQTGSDVPLGDRGVLNNNEMTIDVGMGIEIEGTTSLHQMSTSTMRPNKSLCISTVALPPFLTETKSTHRTRGFLLPVMGSNF